MERPGTEYVGIVVRVFANRLAGILVPLNESTVVKARSSHSHGEAAGAGKEFNAVHFFCASFTHLSMNGRAYNFADRLPLFQRETL